MTGIAMATFDAHKGHCFEALSALCEMFLQRREKVMHYYFTGNQVYSAVVCSSKV
jgi:hypothetical protein